MPKAPHVFRYRIRNWQAYNRALINRGRLTLWFDEQTIAAWRNTEPATGPGAPRLYADLAIECALVFKAVSHLSLRAAQGFLSSVVELLHLTLPNPDYSTVSRRQGALQVRASLTPRSGSCHVVIDATGLRVYGRGSGMLWKPRVGRRRTWRKLHLGVDESTKEIVAVELTASRVHDRQPLLSLLALIPDPIRPSVWGWSLRHASVLRGCAPTWCDASFRPAAHGAILSYQGARRVACRTQLYSAADRSKGTLGVAGAQRVHAAEYCGEYDVSIVCPEKASVFSGIQSRQGKSSDAL